MNERKAKRGEVDWSKPAEKQVEQFKSEWDLEQVPSEFHGVARVLSRRIPGHE